MRFLVTASSTFFATRLIQGLGAHDVEVTAADSHRLSIGKVSRHTVRRLRTPPLSGDPAGFLDAVVGELKTRRYDLLLPTFEESLLLSEFRNEIEPHTRLLLPPFEVMWQLHNKPSLYRLCLDLKIPAPPTVVPGTSLGLEHQVASLTFPVVLKLPAANNSIGRVYCNDLPELIERFSAVYRNELERGAAPPFVQQKIDGELIYTLMFCHRGSKLGEVIYRPLRTYPANGGTSAHRESISHPAIATYSERLAAATGWTGFLGLDFIVDRKEGTPHLIDANTRTNPAVHLGYLAGVDWSALLIDIINGRTPTAVAARPGVRSRTRLLDIAWLLEGLEPRRGWLPRAVERVRKYLRPDWPLDDCDDFLKGRDWKCQQLLTWQAVAALVKTIVTGRPLGQTILEDENYDPTTIGQLRLARGLPATAPTLQPVDQPALLRPISTRTGTPEQAGPFAA